MTHLEPTPEQMERLAYRAAKSSLTSANATIAELTEQLKGRK
jgi:hypothetical protein